MTVYSGYGEMGAPATVGGRSSLSGYDPDYHTYLISQTSPLGTKSFLGYDYNLGLPTLQIDPNGNVSTSATMDWGRRPGCGWRGTRSAGNDHRHLHPDLPADPGRPAAEDQPGRGRTALPPAQVLRRPGTADPAADGGGNTGGQRLFDGLRHGPGRVRHRDGHLGFGGWLEQRQSVPYALSYWYSGKPNEIVPYRGQRIEPGEASPVPYTTTSLDLLGRAVQVTAPDGSTTRRRTPS